MRRIEGVGYAGVFLLVAALAVRLVREDSGRWALGLAVLGGALFLVYFFLAGDQVQRFLSRRSTREGGNVLGVTLFLLGALVVVNLLGSRFRAHVDLTADRLFTLAPETVSALRSADPPPALWIFHPEGSPAWSAMSELGRAARLAAPGVRVEAVDPDREPARAAAFGLNRYAILVETGARRVEVLGLTEEDFVAALRRVVRADTLSVGVLFGHGEAHPEDREEGGLDQAGRLLHRRGLAVRRLNLLEGAPLRERFDVALVPGPRVPLTAAEEESLRAWLFAGGRILVLLDPSRPVEAATLLGSVGLEFRPAFLADPAQPDPQVLVAGDFAGHPAVSDLRDARVAVALRGVGEIARRDPPAGVRSAALLWSGPRAAPVDGGAPIGRRILAAAAEVEVEGGRVGRMVVVGDADFATNALFGAIGNGDLFLGMIEWLTGSDEVVSLRPRERTDRPILVTRQQGRALFIVLALFLPIAVLVGGVFVLRRRR